MFGDRNEVSASILPNKCVARLQSAGANFGDQSESLHVERDMGKALTWAGAHGVPRGFCGHRKFIDLARQPIRVRETLVSCERVRDYAVEGGHGITYIHSLGLRSLVETRVRQRQPSSSLGAYPCRFLPASQQI
jgi:hypothetical protein